MNRKDAGFTLIEALLVMSIIAMIVTVGLPSFASSLARNRVTMTLHLLSADMAMARSSAVTRRRQVVLCPRTAGGGCSTDADWSHGWLVFTDPDGNRRPDAQADILRATDAPHPSGLSVRSTRPYLRYQVDGRSAHSNLTVHVCAVDALAGQVVVNNHGRARVARPRSPTACPHG